MTLDASGATVHLPLAMPASGAAPVDLVLTDVRLGPAGSNDGFSFAVYVNLPPTSTPPSREIAYYVDTFGSFEISIEQVMGMTPVTLTFSLQKPLGLQGGTFGALDLSFVANGRPASGTLVTIGSATVRN
ncbi:MAG: hypothetical protein M3R30_09910 [Candidatus Eremiobacteraeota bacterium]|nr:hypothetical protein [Candidatus Eremiobacteraeota bacterium]